MATIKKKKHLELLGNRPLQGFIESCGSYLHGSLVTKLWPRVKFPASLFFFLNKFIYVCIYLFI